MADELLAGIGSETAVLGAEELREAIKVTLDKLGPKERVLIVPPVRPSFTSNAPVGSCSPAPDPACSRCRTSRGRTPRRASSPNSCTSTMATRSRTSCLRSAPTYGGALSAQLRSARALSLARAVPVALAELSRRGPRRTR